MHRALIAALIAFDALYCALSQPRLLPVAAVAVIAAFLFSRHGSLLFGAMALVATGFLVQSLPAPERFLFFSGAALFGWLLGLVAGGEPLARSGALGALAATYFGAFLDKLGTPDWSGGLRSVLAAQHAWGHLTDPLARFILEHDAAGRALGGFTLVAQASAILMPFSRRGRIISGILLLLFHAGVWLLTPIWFPQAMLLVAAFAFAKEDSAPVGRPRLGLAAAVISLLVTVAWLPWVRAFTHHQSLAGGQPPSAAARARLGEVVEGAILDGFFVGQIDEHNGAIRILLQRGAESSLIEIVPHGARALRPPRTVGDVDLFYRDSAAPLDAVARRLRH